MTDGWRRRARRGGRGVVALFLALLGVGFWRMAGDPGALRPVASGDLAPGFTLPRVTGSGTLGPEEVVLESLRGKVVLIDFWATWCGPCRATLPALERVQHAYRERGVEVVSVNTEGPSLAAEARRMIDRLAPSLTLVSDDGRVADRYQVTIIPHLVLVDRGGFVRLVHRGAGGGAELEEILVSALEGLLAPP